jgi:F-type H+-transporting ATPase subunit epsilon
MTLSVKIIAPDRTVWATEADETILPTSTGQIGILIGHAPLLTALDTGVMRVRTSGKWVPLAVMGGFVEVENDKLIVLVTAAEQGSSIDASQAQVDLDTALALSSQAISPKELLESKKNLKKARTRLQAATLAKA